MITHTIIVSYEFQPTPSRDYDWVAVLDGYDGANEENILGHGATEIEPVKDLLEQINN